MIKFASLFGLAILSTLQLLTVEAYVSSERDEKLTSSPLFGDEEDPFHSRSTEKNSLRGLSGQGTTEKVTICHIPPDDPSDFHTITIDESAKAFHLTHGDREGSCNDNCNILCDGSGPEENCEENGCSTDSPSEIPSASPSTSMIPSASPSASMIPSEVPTIDPSRKTRFVRVQLIGANYLHLREVEVFDRDNVNVALNKFATQSSLYNDSPEFDAHYAVDGDKSISYAHSMSHTKTEWGAWWEVDLLQAVDVKKVIVYNRADCCFERLSNSIVSLLNQERSTLKTYAIGDVFNFEFNVA